MSIRIKKNFGIQMFRFLVLLIIISQCNCDNIEKFSYDIKEFVVPVDHFNFANTNTFNIRYLYNDSFVDKANSNNSALFFYAGNEGDIETFAQNTGFMWELAEQLRAYVIFAEHRYYGKSLPFGSATFNSTQNIGYFSVEQTLEDYAALITTIKNGRAMPVIAFGGSYGGMLAAWFRMKYPHIVNGALASSAPIWQFGDLTQCDIFAKITSSVFTTAFNANCSANIKSSWKLFETLASTDDGKKNLSSIFQLCDPIKTADDLKQFLDFLEDIYGNLAMVNYPYSSNFLAPLPPYPVRQFCLYLKDLVSGTELLKAMQRAVSVYTNFTGSSQCVNYKSTNDGGIDASGWEIQACNQMVMPMCSNLNDTMFRNKEWNFKTYSDDCNNKYHIRPRLDDIMIRYGGQHLETASNIIFSNGLLDPWSGGGVLSAPNNEIVVIIIPEGAHHLDLRDSNKDDPPSVVQARKREIQIISQWIDEFQK